MVVVDQCRLGLSHQRTNLMADLNLSGQTFSYGHSLLSPVRCACAAGVGENFWHFWSIT